MAIENQHAATLRRYQMLKNGASQSC